MKHKVHHGATKKVHSKSKKKHHHKRGLSGVHSMSPAVQDIKENGKKVGGIIIGAFVGNVGAKMLNKMLKTDAVDAGLLKKALVPVLLTGTGFAVAYFMKKDELVKHIGYGLAVSGAASGVKVILKKDLLSGADDEDNAAMEAKYFTETSEQLKKLAQANAAFNPNLNGLGAENMSPTLYASDSQDAMIV